MKFSTVYLLHGKRGSPNGTVSKIQQLLEPQNPGLKFIRPPLPHQDPDSPPAKSVSYLTSLKIPHDSLLIGVSLGGLTAAKLQEDSRSDLHVICISSPTEFQDFKLSKKPSNRISFYSSFDDVISDRVANWPKLAQAHDLPWLTHDTDAHLKKLTKLIQEYINKYQV